MLNYLRLIFLFLFFAGANSMFFGQCTTGTLFPAATFVPQCNQSKVITGSGATNQYSNVSVVVGYQYNFRCLSAGSAAAADFITIVSATGTTPLFSGLNGFSGIYWTATLTGTIRFYNHNSAACSPTSTPRERQVIMAPFQAKIDVTNSNCAGNPGSGQYKITVGPNHGWNFTSIVSPLTANNTNNAGSVTIGTAWPLSYDILTNTSTSVIGWTAATGTNAEICPGCPPLVTNGTSTWSTTSTLTTPFTGYTYLTTTSPYIAGTNTFIAPNVGPVGTYTSQANIVGNNASNQAIAVKPSGSAFQLSLYNSGCGAYMFYPTITAPPTLLFNQSGSTIYSCGSGSIILSANGGTAQYNISWTDGTTTWNPTGNEILASGNTYTIPNLAAGTYTFTLTDANGCQKTINNLIILPSAPPSIPVASVSFQPSCSIPTGTITVTSPVPASGITYSLTGIIPVVAVQTNATGSFPNLAPGTYQIISTVNGCASPTLTAGLLVSAITLPSLPTIVIGLPTCSSAGTATISNYVSGQTYVFTPSGPAVGVGGVISGMTAGTPYTVTCNIGVCASAAASFSINAQLITPADPTILTAAATCSSVGTAVISNYVSGQIYVFTPSGPIVGSGGGISGMVAGTTYTVTGSNGLCTSLNSAQFTIDFQLITPPAPIIATAAPTCLSVGTATISNYVLGETYIFSPSGPTVDAVGAINGLVVGTVYTVTSSNGSCTSTGTSFIINAQLITPEAPIIVTAPATCLSVGTATISNYVLGQTYVFTPSGPLVNASGLISNMTAGTTYTVTSNNGSCTSLNSPQFTIDFQLITPAAPLVDTTAATCLSDGTATISNYVAGQAYVFSPSGPTVGSGGVISGLTAGTPYTVTNFNGYCTSLDSAPFTIDIQLITPVAPLVDTTAATCLSDGTATISNYIAGQTYVFTPSGPSVGSGGVISGLTAATPYTVTNFNGYCTSLDSAPFTIDILLITPAAPLVDTTAATCLSDGTATISNYVAGQAYVFAPSGPSVGSGGVISGMTTGTPYTVTNFNGSCTSLDSAPFTIDILLSTPVEPLVDTTAATCLSDGTATISNYDNALNYTFTQSGPTIDVSGLISSMTIGTPYTVTSSNGSCTSIDSAPFTIDIQFSTPVAPLVDTTAATCLSDGSATISNYDNLLNYTFTPIGPIVDVIGIISNITTGTPYTVTSTNGFCSIDSAPFTIDIQLSTPVEPLVDTTAANCLSDGTATIINYDNLLNYTFTQSGPTIDAIGLISSMTIGTPYTVKSSNGFCTSIDSAPFTIDIQFSTPVAPLVDTTAATCFLEGTATISNYDNILNYTFAPGGPGGPTVDITTGVISNMTTGTSYTVTSNNGFCSIDSAPFTIDIQLSTPVAPIIATLAATCLSDEIATIINYVNTLNYTFTPSGPTIDAIGIISNITTGTPYDLTSTIGSCISQAISLTLEPLLGSFNVIVDTSICSNNLPFTMNSITFITAGTQVATLLTVNGCDSLVTINLSVIANDNSLFSQILPICFGDPLSLPTSSINGFSGTWSPAINNTDTTTYTFTPGIGQCGYIATMTIIVYPQAQVTITDTSICTGGTATLIATGTPVGGSYFWSNANPTSSITVSPNFTTSYSVFYTSLNNCFATATRLLAVNPIPTVTATSDVICAGEIATIVAAGLPSGGTYLWSPTGETTAGINISPNTTSNYSVVYSRLGCESTQVTATVTVNPVPIVTLASEVICIGEDITMTAQTTIAGGIYDWGNGNANATQTFSPLSDSTLTLSYSVNGCTSPIETATITVNPLPISTFSGSPLTGCIPLEVTLLADDNSNTSYSWTSDNGLTGTGALSSLTFTNGGVYDITLTAGLNGCSTTTTINNYVTVDNYPIASFVPSSNSFTEFTQLLEFTNNSSGALTYSWDFGDGTYSTEDNPAHIFTDNLNGHVITLTAYTQFLCANVASLEILFNNGLIYYIPNTFTPNGDEFNQTFKPIFSNSIDVHNYSFYIYNRWGHVIFESHDVEKAWDGLFGADGIPVPQGTYSYKIIVKFTETDERKEFFGHVNVVR